MSKFYSIFLLSIFFIPSFSLLGFEGQEGVLSCTLSVSPENPKVGDNVTLEMTVALLDPEIWVINVTPSIISTKGEGEAVLIDGPTPEVANFTLGEVYFPNLTFKWTFMATKPGSISFSGYASAYSPTLGKEVRSEESSVSIEVEELVDISCVEIHSNRTEASVNETIRVDAVLVAEGNFSRLPTEVGFYLGPPDEGKLLATVYANFTQEVKQMNVWCELKLTQEGEYEIYVYADYQNKILESNEENNVCSAKLVILPAQAYPTSPSPPPTSEAPKSTETAPPTSSPATQPPSEQPVKEKAGITWKDLVYGSIIAGLAATTGYLIYTLLGLKCCCSQWNFRKGKIEVKAVKPKDGRRIFVPYGGALPLIAKAINVDRLSFRCRSLTPSGKIRGEVGVELPIPDELTYKWEILEGPGYLIGPYQHNHSGSVFGPIAVYQAPDIPQDPELAEEVKKGLRNVKVRLTVDDLQRKVYELDSHPPKVLDVEISLTEDIGRFNPDYSEVITEIFPEDLPEAQPPGILDEKHKKEIRSVIDQMKEKREKIKQNWQKAAETCSRYNELSKLRDSLLGMLGKKMSDEDLIRSVKERKEELPEEMKELLKRYKKTSEDKLKLEKEIGQLEKEIKEKYEIIKKAGEPYERRIREKSSQMERIAQMLGPTWKQEIPSRDFHRRKLEELSKELEELEKERQEVMDRAVEETGVHRLEEDLKKSRDRLEILKGQLRELLSKIRGNFLEWIDQQIKGLSKKYERAKNSMEKLFRDLRELYEKRSSLMAELIEKMNEKLKKTECKPFVRWKAFKPITCSILAPQPMKILDKIPLSRFSPLYHLTKEGRPRSTSSYVSLLKRIVESGRLNDFPRIREKAEEILSLEQEKAEIIKEVVEGKEDRSEQIRERQTSLIEEIAELAEKEVKKEVMEAGKLLPREADGRAKVVWASTGQTLILQAEARDPDELEFRCGPLSLYDGGRKPFSIPLNDRVRYEWSIVNVYHPKSLLSNFENAVQMDGELAGMQYRGAFLVTKNGSSVVYLTPIEKAVVTIRCRAYDSGMQGIDTPSEDYVVVVVDRYGPAERLLNAKLGIEERIKRLNSLVKLIEEQKWEIYGYKSSLKKRIEEEEADRRFWSTLFNIVSIAIGITGFFVPVAKLANMIMATISTGTAAGFAVPSLMWTWEQDPSLELITNRVESDIEGVFSETFAKMVKGLREHYKNTEGIDPIRIAKDEDAELPELKKALAFFDSLEDSLEKLEQKVKSYIEELESQREGIINRIERMMGLRGVLLAIGLPSS